MDLLSEPCGSMEIVQKSDGKLKIEPTKLYNNSDGLIPSLCFFKEPINRIVIGTGSGNIRVFSYDSETETLSPLLDKKPHTDFIFELLKWDEDEGTILSGSSDSKIILHSILEPYRQLKKVDIINPNSVRKMLKVEKNLVICRATNSRIILVNIEKEEIIRTYDLGYLMETCLFNVYLSKRFPGCFYTSTQGLVESIKLVDWKESILRKEFAKENNAKGRVNYTFSLFENSRKEEIIITIEDYDKIFYFNTSSSKFDKNEKIKELEDRPDTINPSNGISDIYASCNLNNQFLCAGSKLSKFYIYEVTGNGKMSMYQGKGIGANYFYNLYVHEKSQASSCCKLIYCSGDGNVCHMSIKGLVLKNNWVVDEDEIERISFLRDNFDEYMFSELEKKNMLMRMELQNLSIDSFPRTLLFSIRKKMKNIFRM